jgi:hypothetical protein
VFESVCTCRILLLKYLLPCATCWELYYTRHSDKSLKCHFPSEKEGLILDRARKAEYNKAITCFILRKSRLKLGPFIMHSLGKRTLADPGKKKATAKAAYRGCSRSVQNPA